MDCAAASPQFAIIDIAGDDNHEHDNWFSCAKLLGSQPDQAASPMYAVSSLGTWLAVFDAQTQHQLPTEVCHPAQPSIKQELLSAANAAIPIQTRATAANVASIFTHKVQPVRNRSPQQQENSTSIYVPSVSTYNATAQAAAAFDDELTGAPVTAVQPGPRPAAAAAAAVGSGAVNEKFKPNLTKPKLSKQQKAELQAQFGNDEEGMQAAIAEIALQAYCVRGPQAMRRALVRQLCALFPQAEPVYQRLNEGLSKRGGQWEKERCDEFFTGVLGPAGGPFSAPCPCETDLRPLKELQYLARLLSWMVRRLVTASEVNDLFVAGQAEITVNYCRLLQLGIDANSLTLPLQPVGYGAVAGSTMSSGTAPTSTALTDTAAVRMPTKQAAGKMAAGLSRQAGKRKKSQHSTGKGDKRTKAAAAHLPHLVHMPQLIVGLPQ